MSVLRINRLFAQPHLAEDLFEFLRSVLPAIQAADGCESAQLLRGKDDPNEFVLLETWASIAAHKQAANTIPPDQYALILPMMAKPPTGAYYVL